MKRALSFPNIIRTPCQELCPYCQRLKEEDKEREAIEAHSGPAAPPRRQMSPRREPATVPLQRSNTVSAGDSHSGQLVESFVDPAAPRNPYRDTKMEMILNQNQSSEADYLDMSERVIDGLLNEKPADRDARLTKMNTLQQDWKGRDKRMARDLSDLFGPKRTRIPQPTSTQPPKNPEPSSSLTNTIRERFSA